MAAAHEKQINNKKFTEKMIFKTSHRHIFINQKPLISISAIANQLNKVRMMQQT